MTYQTAVFDLDGTLLNTLEDLADAVNYSLKKNKMPLCTITQVCQYVGNGIVKLMERAVPSGKDNPVFEQALSDFKEYYAEHCHDKTALYPGILALLQNLKKKGVKMAVVSNKADFAVKELMPVYFPNWHSEKWKKWESAKSRHRIWFIRHWQSYGVIRKMLFILVIRMLT